MKNWKLFGMVLMLILPLQSAFAQGGAFDNLNGTWKGEGKWNNGPDFKQEITYSWDIPGKVVHTLTKGNISQKGYEFGVRSSGIRTLQGANGQFWEFDVFGQVTEGSIAIKDKNLYLTYSYDTPQGKQTLTDAWEYVDANHYNFKVGAYSDGKWEALYLEAVFTRQ